MPVSLFIMKPLFLVPLLLTLVLSGCDREDASLQKRLSELESQAAKGTEREKALESQLAEQTLAIERESTEREQAALEAERLALQQKQIRDSKELRASISAREAALAKREARVSKLQADADRRQVSTPPRRLTPEQQNSAGRSAVVIPDARANPAFESRQAVGSFSTFHRSLSPYGAWLQTPNFGYVWRPAAARNRDWRPYSRGRWACTNRGWTWMSDEPFGWAVYHYGRWALLRNYGWVWVPGDEWAPAWVTWRESESVVGWAPLPPETLAWGSRPLDSSVEVRFGIGAAWFTFVSVRSFSEPIYRYQLPIRQNVTLIQNTVNITNINVTNNTIIVGGPLYTQMSEAAGRPLPFYNLQTNQRALPGRDPTALRPRIDGDDLIVAAPRIDAPDNLSLKPDIVQGRLDRPQVEREEKLDPEVSEELKDHVAIADVKTDENLPLIEKLPEPLARPEPTPPIVASDLEEPVQLPEGLQAPSVPTPNQTQQLPEAPQLAVETPLPQQPAPPIVVGETEEPVLPKLPQKDPIVPVPNPSQKVPEAPQLAAETPLPQQPGTPTANKREDIQAPESQQEAPLPKLKETPQESQQAETSPLPPSILKEVEDTNPSPREKAQQAEEVETRQAQQEAQQDQQEAQRAQQDEARKAQQDAQRAQQDEARQAQQEAQRAQQEEARQAQREAQQAQQEEARQAQQDAQRAQQEEARQTQR